MKKSEWNDNHIEELLSQLPSVRDDRDPHDIYQLISKQVKKKKQKSWMLPSIASVCVVLLLFILSPVLTGTNQFAGDEAVRDQSSAKMEMNIKMNQTTKEKGSNITEQQETRPENKTEENFNTFIMNDNMESTAVYKQEVVNQDVLTYGIPDQNIQNIIPVSILVPKLENKIWLDQLADWMPKLTEEKWGLAEYYPLQGKFTFNTNERYVNLDLLEGHKYGTSSTSETTFTNALKTTFQHKGIEKLILSTNGRPGVELSHTGILNELYLTENQGNHPYLLFYTGSHEEQPFLVPSPNSYISVEEALDEMKTEIVEYQLKPAIPHDIKIELIEKNGEKLLIGLSPSSKLKNNTQFVYLIEAVLLTAKDFGFTQVEIKQPSISQIGPFDLTKPLEVPIAANKKNIE